MLKAYKYRIYPTVEQQQIIENHFGCCRLVFNLALSTKIYAWESARINLTFYDLQKQLIDLKKTYHWLYKVNAQSLQSELFHLHQSYQRFFKGVTAFPKFKGRYDRQSYQYQQNVKVNFQNNTIFIPKVKNVKASISCPFKGQIKTCTVSKTATGKYFISILVDNKADLPAKPLITEQSTIGIDVGIKSFVVASDGRQFEPNRKLKDNLKRLQCIQRRASRKAKGSSNRKKANKRVATLHERIANERLDYIHKITHALTHDNQVGSIVIENLNVSGLLKNEKLAQAISDVSFGKFFEVLKYKCEWYGKNLIIIDRWAPSSKRCSCCGAINDELTLADREWTCTECGAHHERDHNASKNIRWYGLQQTIFSNEPPVGSRVGPVESRRLRRTKKQENV